MLLLCGFSTAYAEGLRTLEWEELVPANAPPLPPPVPLHDLDLLGEVLVDEYGMEEFGPAAKQEHPNAPVVPELHGLRIKLPGFIVPLTIDDNERVTEFLLVPYFGACIHVPPPPSNQIIYVTYEGGVALDDTWQPFWIEGTLSVESFSSEMADTGYSATVQRMYPYED